MDPSLLATAPRRAALTAYLASVAPTTEIVCLQEVALSEFAYFAAALGSRFQGAMAFNDPDFWSNWIVPEIPWQPNGPAIFVRKNAFDHIAISDRPLGTGNHAAVVEATLAATGRTIRAWSIHLDSDRESNRGSEFDTVLAGMPALTSATDIACGDFNEDSVLGGVGAHLRQAGFVDAHESVGQRRATHPWSTQYYNSTRWAIIDHVVVRNGQPVAATVVDGGLAGITDELERIEATLRQKGSDHYAVTATISVN
jgi:endonuclease/exonuclease/phosphatase family metal-dependent hydrolase